jgi:CRP-like cAMP-binding protein
VGIYPSTTNAPQQEGPVPGLEQDYDEGALVFKEGDPSDLAFVILSGRVAIVRKSPQGELTLAELGTGAMFGEMSLVDERPRSAGARAITSLRLQPLTREHFLFQILHEPQQAMGHLQVLFERLRTMNARLFEAESASRPLKTGRHPWWRFPRALRRRHPRRGGGRAVPPINRC